jgi:uncharacterized membrane protein
MLSTCFDSDIRAFWLSLTMGIFGYLMTLVSDSFSFLFDIIYRILILILFFNVRYFSEGRREEGGMKGNI